jgi:hypothetical protein
VTTITEARAVRDRLLADYKAAHPEPRPEAQTVIDRLSAFNDAPTLFVLKRIVDAWPAKPVRPPRSPDGVTDITGREDEFFPPPWWSLVDALVAGVIVRAGVVRMVGEAKRVRAAILKAPHVDDIDRLLVTLDAPSEVRDALRFVRGYIETREEEAYHLLDVAPREGLTETGKSKLDGRTREGLRQAVRRIDTMAPKAAHEDIRQILGVVFDLPTTTRADGTYVIDVEGLMEERRAKSAKERAKGKAARKARPKPRPEG